MSKRFALQLTLLITLVTTATSAWCFWLAARRQQLPLQIVPGRVDLGEVFLYEDKDFEVEVRNPGKQVVEIVGVRLDCACANVRLGGLRLKPGEATRLTGTLQGRRKPGLFARQLIVSVKEPERCHFRLPIVGEARRRISYSPESLILRLTGVGHPAPIAT